MRKLGVFITFLMNIFVFLSGPCNTARWLDMVCLFQKANRRKPTIIWQRFLSSYQISCLFFMRKQLLQKLFSTWNRIGEKDNWAPQPTPNPCVGSGPTTIWSRKTNAVVLPWNIRGRQVCGEARWTPHWNGFVEHHGISSAWVWTWRHKQQRQLFWKHPIQWEQDMPIRLLLLYLTAFWSKPMRTVEQMWPLPNEPW